MTKQFTYGAIPSPQDLRDSKYQIVNFYSVKSSFPKEYKPKQLIPAMNQLSYGMCVSYAIELITAYHELEERGTLQRFSQGYIYGNRMDDDHKGEGMVTRQALNNFRIYGTPPNSILPDRGTYSMLKDKITPEMHSLAATQRIKSYSAVQTVDEIKTALMENGAVLIVIPIYNSFNNCPKDGMLKMPDTFKENILGYHAIVIIGWRSDNRWIIQNSWGRLWGDRRKPDYCIGYMPFEYPIREKWALVDEELPVINKEYEYNIKLKINDKNFYVNDNKFTIDVAPFIKNNRTFIPLRGIMESIGAKVNYKSNTKEVNINLKM